MHLKDDYLVSLDSIACCHGHCVLEHLLVWGSEGLDGIAAQDNGRRDRLLRQSRNLCLESGKLRFVLLRPGVTRAQESGKLRFALFEAFFAISR